MNERIKFLRNTLCMTLEDFGKRVGVTRSAIGRIEKGERGVTEQMILSICREFDINEEWLRTGNGEMKLISSEDDEVMKYVGLLLKDREDFVAQKIKRFIIGYEKLDAEDRKVVEKLMRQVFEDEKKEQD